MNLKYVIGAMLFGVAPITSVHAIAPSVSLTSDVWILRDRLDPNGKAITVLEKPVSIVPGDLLLFEIHARNQGDKAATSIDVTNPVPASVDFLSANDSPSYSVDGGRSWGALSELKILMPDGRYRLAQPGDVTHIRWKIDEIAIGAETKRSFRGRVR
jgi:uncharacterized repeat protein (TIGR01451 family)